MAKKTKKTGKKTKTQLPENMLPQNILPMGERVEENKNIYISQSVYKQIHKFTRNKTKNESGGMLVGKVIEEFGKSNIVISGFVEAKYAEGTPTTLKFTHETWEYVHKEIDKKHKGQKILGWIHTHPDFGIFLSEYDKFIHQNFFSDAHQIAYVVDPIQNIEGFYFWVNGNIEKCRGFYIYDRTGVDITVEAGKATVTGAPEKPLFSIKNVLIAVLAAAVAFLTFAQISANKKLEQLQTQYQALVTTSNQNIAYLFQEVGRQSLEIQELKELLPPEENGETQPEEETAAPDSTAPTEVSAETGDGAPQEGTVNE